MAMAHVSHAGYITEKMGFYLHPFAYFLAVFIFCLFTGGTVADL